MTTNSATLQDARNHTFMTVPDVIVPFPPADEPKNMSYKKIVAVL